MVMGSVTSYLLGSTVSGAADAALDAVVFALPVDPPEQAVMTVAAAIAPVAIRKLRREIFFMVVVLLSLVIFQSARTDRPERRIPKHKGFSTSPAFLCKKKSEHAKFPEKSSGLVLAVRLARSISASKMQWKVLQFSALMITHRRTFCKNENRLL
jgi:hypothetical protein